MLYVFIFYARLSFHKNQSVNQSFGVSIIICSRNEERNLRKFLPKVLKQNYENFEVIVVNDRSWDGTVDYLRNLKKSNKSLLKALILP